MHYSEKDPIARLSLQSAQSIFLRMRKVTFKHSPTMASTGMDSCSPRQPAGSSANRRVRFLQDPTDVHCSCLGGVSRPTKRYCQLNDSEGVQELIETDPRFDSTRLAIQNVTHQICFDKKHEDEDESDSSVQWIQAKEKRQILREIFKQVRDFHHSSTLSGGEHHTSTICASSAHGESPEVKTVIHRRSADFLIMWASLVAVCRVPDVTIPPEVFQYLAGMNLETNGDLRGLEDLIVPSIGTERRISRKRAIRTIVQAHQILRCRTGCTSSRESISLVASFVSAASAIDFQGDVEYCLQSISQSFSVPSRNLARILGESDALAARRVHSEKQADVSSLKIPLPLNEEGPSTAEPDIASQTQLANSINNASTTTCNKSHDILANDSEMSADHTWLPRSPIHQHNHRTGEKVVPAATAA